MYERKKVYILVKTYPSISNKYAELVCTAGLLEDGSWIRLYPMPFRLLDDDKQYPKYTWIDVDVERNSKDFRPESYRPLLDSVFVHEKPPVDWNERRKIILGNTKVYTNLTVLIDETRDTDKSLALFKPTKIHKFEIKPVEREWDQDKLNSLRAESQQLSLFKTIEEIDREFKVVKKLPYKFSYEFEDDSGKIANLMIEDWEIGALFFNCLKHANGNEEKALDGVRKKYFDNYVNNRDVYLSLGTTLRNHKISKNPFIIIGVLPLEKEPEYPQLSLF